MLVKTQKITQTGKHWEYKKNWIRFSPSARLHLSSRISAALSKNHLLEKSLPTKYFCQKHGGN